MCGYCDRSLVRMPEGDWACPPCRRLMNEVVVGPEPLFRAQMRRFATLARRRRGSGKATVAAQGRLFS
jgi:hypothetical protein